MLADHLIPVLKEIAADEDARLIWQGINLGRKTLPLILQQVIAGWYKESLAQCLNNSRFAVQIDEKMDRTLKNLCCVIVRYVDFESRKTLTTLW